MSKRDILKMAQEERNRVPLGDFSAFQRAQAKVQAAYDDLARG